MYICVKDELTKLQTVKSLKLLVFSVFDVYACGYLARTSQKNYFHSLAWLANYYFPSISKYLMSKNYNADIYFDILGSKCQDVYTT